MTKQYSKSLCKLLPKDENVKEIVARNKNILETYDFTTVLNTIQQKFNRIQTISTEKRDIAIAARLIHCIYEDDKISNALYDDLDNKLVTILKEDFGYDVEIKGFGGGFFETRYLVFHL